MFDLIHFLNEDEINALALVRDGIGVDTVRTYQFWEAAVARMTSGRTTDHRCPWDVELDYPDGRTIRIEVKYSQENLTRFSQGIRPVYRYANPKGRGREKAADVMVFIGVGPAGEVDLWVTPGSAVPQSPSITVTVPRVRIGDDRSVLSGYDVPFDQLLPAILNAWRAHLHYDRDHHAETRRRTLGIMSLFDTPTAPAVTP